VAIDESLHHHQIRRIHGQRDDGAVVIAADRSEQGIALALQDIEGGNRVDKLL
jgi:hypothetical protein